MDIVRASIREIPDFPQPGILFRDITPLLETPSAFGYVIDEFVARYDGCSLDRIVAIESRGFLFGAALADRLDVGLAVVRKPGKLPFRVIRQEYDLEYGTDALEMHIDAVSPNHRVIVIDDLLATGGTAAAATALVHAQGAEVIECAFVIELAGLRGRQKLGDIPVYALITFEGA
jgi:adenine phosphoribosyltransferase